MKKNEAADLFPEFPPVPSHANGFIPSSRRKKTKEVKPHAEPTVSRHLPSL